VVRDVSDPSGTFAGYRLEQVLSADTVSTTYRAMSERRSGVRGRPVALRVVQPLRTSDGPDVDAMSDFMRVISDAVVAAHPSLAAILDAGEVDDRVYVATELVAGPTLDEYLRHHGPLAPAAAVALLGRIAEGLDQAHSGGVLHGAISPRTVLIDQHATGAPRAVLTGFGLEHLLSRQAHRDRSSIDLVDVCYVAPEQLGGGAIDGRADQYALACALYHSVAGRPPFVRDTIAALFGAHLFSEARVPAGRGGDTPLEPAVATGMAKRPDERHPSCAALITATGLVPSEQPAPRRAGRTARASRPGVRLRTNDDVPSISEQAAGRRARRRMRRRRLPIPWPVAAMVVLAGIICTLVLAAILRDDAAVDGGSPSGTGRRVSAGPAPADIVGMAGTVQAAVEWQQHLDTGPIRALAVAGDVVVAGSERLLTALAIDDGTQLWHSETAGPLTGVVATDRVVGVRASGLHGLSPVDGTVRWSNADVLAPLGALTASPDAFYGIRRGRVAPELVALDAGTGERTWSFNGGDAVLEETAAVAVDGAHLAVLQGDRVFSVDTAIARSADRAVHPRWDVRVRDPWAGGLAVTADAVVVATRDGRVCAYATGGDQLWCATIVGLTDHEPAVAVNGDTVAVIMRSHVALLALDSGELEWVFDAPRELLPIAAVQGDQVVVAGASGNLHGLDVVRRYEAWQASGLGEITALASDDGTVCAATAEGLVVHIRPGGALES
jgi:outer membrane protein assembly factor BamB